LSTQTWHASWCNACTGMAGAEDGHKQHFRINGPGSSTARCDQLAGMLCSRWWRLVALTSGKPSRC